MPPPPPPSLDGTAAAATTAAAVRSMLLPGAAAADMPPTNTTITLSTDAQTLRPAVLEVLSASADGTLAVQLRLVFSGWDGPSVIDPPVVGS